MDDQSNTKARSVGADRLRVSGFFRSLAAGDLADLAAHAEFIDVPARGCVVRHGDPADALIIVERGHVILFLGERGDPNGIARVAGPGELFGEASLLKHAASPVTAQAFEPCSLIRIPAEPVRALIEQRFDVMMALLGYMSVRLRKILLQLMDLKMKTTTQRLGSYLCSLTAAGEGPAELKLPYDRSLLAAELGMQPETFSRAMMKLQTVGVRDGGTGESVVVQDIGALRRFCEGEGEE